VVLLAFAASAADRTPPAARPNIVLMIADDLGYADLGCYGANLIATPRIDALAAQGLRFLDAHSYSGICMPSRYTILTGRYAFRSNRSMNYAYNFDEGQVLLPAAFKSAGYRTAIRGRSSPALPENSSTTSRPIARRSRTWPSNNQSNSISCDRA
jgi:arylsulfatase A-like enzyme